MQMTKLEYSDHMLEAQKGETLLVAEPISGVNMTEGGVIEYRVGDRLRVKHTLAGLLWCFDDEARSVSFSRMDMYALERPTKKEGE